LPNDLAPSVAEQQASGDTPSVTRAHVAAGADGMSIAVARDSREDVYLELVEADPEAPR
jgi:hypothetical protein